MAPLWPASTVWPGPLRLATAQTSPSADFRGHRGDHGFGVEAEDGGHGPHAHGHRLLHQLAAPAHQAQGVGEVEGSGRDQGRVLAQAVPGHGHRRRLAEATLGEPRRMAIEAASRAGWVLAVSVSSSSGPSQQSWESGKPSAASASSKTARAAGDASAQALPMPTFCEPWPGKTRAVRLERAGDAGG